MQFWSNPWHTSVLLYDDILFMTSVQQIIVNSKSTIDPYHISPAVRCSDFWGLKSVPLIAFTKVLSTTHNIAMLNTLFISYQSFDHDPFSRSQQPLQWSCCEKVTLALATGCLPWNTLFMTWMGLTKNIYIECIHSLMTRDHKSYRSLF